ncbi:MAG: dTDP-glucose 4,6-dehydratase [Patescibacteria group bacterium]
MKILVTGGAGFMASNFIRYILQKYPDYKIVNLDKLTYSGNPENLKDIDDNPNYQFVCGDIANENDVKKAIEGVDAIINYAAETHVDQSLLHPDQFVKTNVLGTCVLLEAIRKFGIKRFIQISTDEVFGAVLKGTTNEEAPFKPRSPYSASKAGADHLAYAYFTTYNAPVIITHSCNFFGPYQFPEKLIPRFITNLLEGKKVPVYTPGNQIREWIFTEDHCSAIDAILHRGQIGEIYNIGTGYRKTNLEITKKIIKLFHKNEDEIEYVKDRPGHDVRYAVNSNKLRGELGWKPEYGFNEALKKTVSWYANNSNWWKPLKKKSEALYKNWGK